MKNKKIIALTVVTLLLIMFGSFLIPVKAEVGLYEQRTNPSNPFLFSIDVIYVTSDGWISASGIQYFYHQVFLEANKHYIFYDPIGYMTMENARIWIHSSINTTVDDYFEHIYEDDVYGYNLYINPSQTGLYNITIRWGTEGFDTNRGSYGIGVLEIPIVSLNTEISFEYWDFQTNSIMAGIIELNSNTEYQTGYDEQSHDYLGLGPIYYANINSLYSIPYLNYAKLDGSHELMDYGGGDIITTNNLGQGSGKYIFYSLSGGMFSLMEALEEDIIEPNIPSFNPLIIIGIIGSVSTISVIMIRKKINKKSKF